MISILTYLFLLVSQLIPFPGPAMNATTGPPTMTVIQHTSIGCSGSTCAVNVSPTGVGNLLIMVGSGTFTAAAAFSSGSDNGSAETWSSCPGFLSFINVGGTYYSQDCGYVLSSTGGATTITFNWSNSMSSDTVEVLEVRLSIGTFSGIGGNGNTNRTFCSSCTAPSIAAFTGTNDYALQVVTTNGATVSSITGAYTNPTDFPISTFGVAGALDISSYSAPSWGAASAGIALVSVEVFK